jgi:beta-fructofuranosidase
VSKDYIKGCESQSVAFSTGLGISWHRYESNPLLATPPKKEATTGLRDPFVSRLEKISTLLGLDHSTDYMILASGERAHGSQLYIYQSNNLLDWEPVGTVLDVKAGSKIPPRGNLKFGMNFECASFFSIGSNDYLTLGVEEDQDSTRHNCRYAL